MTQLRQAPSQTKLFAVAFASLVAGIMIALAGVFYWQSNQFQAMSETRGKDLATLVCARCHSVGLKGESKNPKAPPFRDLIAKLSREGLQEQLDIALSLGHKPMPPWNLSAEQADNLAAYISSLGKN